MGPCRGVLPLEAAELSNAAEVAAKADCNRNPNSSDLGLNWQSAILRRPTTRLWQGLRREIGRELDSTEQQRKSGTAAIQA